MKSYIMGEKEKKEKNFQAWETLILSYTYIDILSVLFAEGEVNIGE